MKADNHTTLRNFTSYCTSSMSFPPPHSSIGISEKILKTMHKLRGGEQWFQVTERSLSGPQQTAVLAYREMGHTAK